MRRTTLYALAGLLLLPSASFALGIGKLQRLSVLNEPFSGRIELISKDPDELESLKVELAGAAEFERAGVQWVAVVNQLRFEIVLSDSGRDFVRVTSAEPIREPFLNFLLEINWASGRLIREYTVLLDPPLYDPGRRMAPGSSIAAAPPSDIPTAIARAEERRQTRRSSPRTRARGDISGIDRPTESGDTLWAITAQVRPDDAVTMQQAMLALLRTNPEAFIDENVNNLKRGYVLQVPGYNEFTSTSRAEALEEIVRQHALWEEYRGVRSADTTPEPIGTPTIDYSPPEESYAAEPEPVGDEPDIDDEARLRLVSPTDDDMGASHSVGAAELEDMDLDALRNELALASERTSAMDQENVDLRDELGEADELISTLERLINVREQELAALQEQLADGEFADTTDEIAEPVDEPIDEPIISADDADDEAFDDSVTDKDEITLDLELEQAPALADEVAPQPQTPGLVAKLNSALGGIVPESLLAKIPGGALTLIGIIVFIFILIGFFVMRVVRGQGSEFDSEPVRVAAVEDAIESGTDLEAVTELPDEADPTIVGGEGAQDDDDDELEDKTQIVAPDGPAAEAEDEPTALEPEPEPQPPAQPEEDPLAEVNVYLAYERFDQAEELVKKAIADEPDNHQFKLRLLEVYYSSNNKAAYENTARELNDAVGGAGELWDNAVAMWQEMSPERALFEAGAVEEAEAPSADAAKEFVDITAELPIEPAGAQTVTIKPEGVDLGGVDLDLGMSDADEDILDLTATASGADAEEGVLDITSGDDDGGLLDITSAEEPEESSDVFDLTAGEADLTPAPAEPISEDPLDVTATGSISTLDHPDLLNVTVPGSVAAESSEGVQEDAATEFDLTSGEISLDDDESASGNALEFDISGGAEPELEPLGIDEPLVLDSELETDDNVLEFDTGDLSMDLSDAVDAPRESSETAPEDTNADQEEDADEEDATELFIETVQVVIPEPVQAEEEIVLDFPGDADDADDDELSAADLSLDLSGGEEAEESAEISLDELGESPASDAPSLDALTQSLEDTVSGMGLTLDLDDASSGDLELDTSDADGDELSLELDSDSGELELELDSADESGGGLDLDLQIEDDEASGASGLDTVELEADALDETPAAERTIAMPRSANAEQSDADEVDTKLNLAKAYIELGDKDGARAILDEVAAEGTDEQKLEAQQLSSQTD